MLGCKLPRSLYSGTKQVMENRTSFCLIIFWYVSVCHYTAAYGNGEKCHLHNILVSNIAHKYHKYILAHNSLIPVQLHPAE